MTMKKPIIVSILCALAALLMYVPAADAASASVSASASVNVKLAPDPTGAFLVGTPPVPVVRPHRVTVGLHRGPVFHSRVLGLAPTGVVYVGARARPLVLVASPVIVVDRPGVVVGSPGVIVDRPSVVVDRPGVVVGAPGVVVGAPGVVVGAPAVVVGAPVIAVGGPRVVVGAPSPVIIVKGKHDNGLHRGHHKHRH